VTLPEFDVNNGLSSFTGIGIFTEFGLCYDEKSPLDGEKSQEVWLMSDYNCRIDCTAAVSWRRMTMMTGAFHG
jgi:hypothetical protein